MKTLASCAVVAVLVVGAPAAWGQASWRGLVVAAANRCAPYDSDEYGYSQNLELAAIASMGGGFTDLTRAGGSLGERKRISSILWRDPKRTIAGCVRPLPPRSGSSPTIC